MIKLKLCILILATLTLCSCVTTGMSAPGDNLVSLAWQVATDDNPFAATKIKVDKKYADEYYAKREAEIAKMRQESEAQNDGQ